MDDLRGSNSGGNDGHATTWIDPAPYTPLRTAQSISGFSKTREPMDNYPTPDIATLSRVSDFRD